ncbi:hypothetical protein A3K73_07800 [Candidatus Pacearchaeota archaeon RBG_13_36_9]|nr:MAG: hypothetical protein A3K73_07800 [Candidatus Pacearchaeota archaeon RBG_13_36_9]
MKKLLFFLTFAVLLLDLASASHYIVGIVNNAEDGENANGKRVVLWNPSNGINDNLTDIIGPTGNSGADNVYMIDCELLSAPCDIGEEIRVRVLNGGDNYISYWVNLSVTGAGYDVAPNITLNSIPNATLVFPVNYGNFSDEVTFNCSASDPDGLSNITLYGNWSGGWHANETKEATGNNNQTFFTKNLSEGKYFWNCLATDNLSVSNFSSANFSVTIDRTAPEVSAVEINESYVCGNSYVRVNCSAEDLLTDIDHAVIEAKAPSFSKNHSTQLLAGNTYYADILVNESGYWSFNCIANDSAGNRANLTSSAIRQYSSSPDLRVESSGINFSNYGPIENEDVIVEAVIYNDGCSDANNFLVGFYSGASLSNQINGNRTVSVSQRANSTANVTWSAEIGITNFYVFADINNSIIESNEDNNEANKTLFVGAWQEFYGNISSQKLLADNLTFNMTLWENASNLQGNVFISDIESSVDWGNLQAIGRNASGASASDDFSDIDISLGMTGFSDSVYSTFTEAGTPKNTGTFLVHQKQIYNVPVINSTNTINFITGILWDKSDDSDGQFSQGDKEDLVFITKLNEGSSGMYGKYDYEITIPVRLREYKEPDASGVYIYYDLN